MTMDAPILPPEKLNVFTGYLAFSENEKEVVDIIVPNPKPKPGAKIVMGKFDQTLIPVWNPILLVFKNENKKPDFMEPNKLKHSLSLALGRIPALSGSLGNTDGTPFDVTNRKKLQVNLTNKGAWVCIAKTDMEFDQFMNDHVIEGFFPQAFRFKKGTEAIMKIDSSSPLITLKLVYFPCGSVIISSFFCHLVCDGKSMFDFYKLWGKINRGIEPSPTMMDSRHLVPTINHTPESLKLAKELKENSFPCAPELLPLIMCNVSISLKTLKNLKSYVDSKLSNGQYVSREDIFTSLIWRALIRARRLDSETFTNLRRTVELRKQLNLAPDAFGNFIMSNNTGLKVSELLSMPLHQCALILRKHVKSPYIQNFQKVVLNSPKDDMPNILDNFDPSKDFYATSITQMLLDPIDLDGAPAKYMRSECTFHNTILILPPFNGKMSGMLGINPTDASALGSDQELKECGISVEFCNPPDRK